MSFFTFFVLFCFEDKFKGFARIWIMMPFPHTQTRMHHASAQKLFPLPIGKTFLFVGREKNMIEENLIRAWNRA